MSKSRTAVLILVLCAAVAFACLAYPIYVIRPFRYQGPAELMAALAVTRWRPLITMICAAAAIAAAALHWRSEKRRWRRGAALAGAAIVAAFAVLSHVNVYERMFHPLDQPRFSAASESKLDGDEMVIAVRSGGAARAYPIRILAYHHIANDTVGGVPIAATY